MNESEVKEFNCAHCKLAKREVPKVFRCESWKCKNEAQPEVCCLCESAYILKHRHGDYFRCPRCSNIIYLKGVKIERKTIDDFVPPFLREYLWDTFSLGCIGLVGTWYFTRAPYTPMTAVAFVGAHLISLGMVFGYHVVDALKIQSAYATFFSKEKRSFYHWFIALYTMSYFAAVSFSPWFTSRWTEWALVAPPAAYVAGSIINFCAPNYFHLHKVVPNQ